MIVYNNIESGLTEVYLGDVSISEVYIGDEKVFPSGEPTPVFTGKFYGEYYNDKTLTLECNGEPSTLEIQEISNNIHSLTAVTFGGCLWTVGGNICPFADATSLKKATLNEGVKKVDNITFQNCRALNHLSLPNSLERINMGAFSGCTSLTEVNIPTGITRIYNSAFRDCTKLTNITINATTPPTLGTNVFDNTNNCPIYVPTQSLEAYKTATNWSTYADRIQAIQT